jgi:hypothetical protein
MHISIDRKKAQLSPMNYIEKNIRILIVIIKINFEKDRFTNYYNEIKMIRKKVHSME